MINFNSQDVANMYRRNQLANALQERMNAPTPVHTYQGFQAPISPLTGIAKALDVYSVFQNEKNQEKQYQDEKTAAEQKAQSIIDSQNEEATQFGKQFNPVVSEKMIGGNTSFTPTQYANAINAYGQSNQAQLEHIYGKPKEPTQASDMLNGEPTTYERNEGTLQTTSTPRTREEMMRLESEGIGSNNPQMNKIAENRRQSRVADETAQAVKDAATLERGKGININGQLVNPSTGDRIGEQIPSQKESPTTSINISNKTGESLGRNAAELLSISATKAEGAVSQLNSINNILKATDNNEIFSGITGSIGLRLAQVADAMGVGGKDNAEKIINTRATIQGLAQMTLAGRQEMKGQGAITQSESELAQKAVSGDISDLTIAEIQQIARTSERVARFNLEQHNRKLKVMQNNPEWRSLSPFYESAPPPDSYVMKKNRVDKVSGKTPSGATVSQWDDK